ncbi:phage terminase large subunit family protein [Helicobacter sp. faydin-H20]|uniref:phage terminase large subunit family protein n=1 Tax=Helicobacter anatolicus TaxID=2905874 RepID=UPI001E3AAB4D|nr:terminase gpA endonuclease subunit [Helicobacter anatolicus]MCE3037499.1 phage terminase large subunit family protein [Helicobacter anatolicus]
MELIQIFCNSIFIKPRLNLLEWSEKYRILSQESSAHFGRFKALPYQKEVMEEISNEENQEIVLMWASQLGKSEILNNTLGYFIHQDPATILFLLPTEDIAEDYSKRRLAPMFRDIKELRELIYNKDSNNTILLKNFKGGNLALVGSNSPSKLASKPIRVLIVDEVDRCEVTKEGHSIDLAQKRTNTFYNRKIIKVSTPTITGSSVIEKEFEGSDKRRYYVPCPYCKFYQTLIFSQIKWEQDTKGEHLIDTARYMCIECEKLWSEEEKNKAVSKGRWEREKESKKVGFFLNAIYSPFFKMSEIVKDFLESKDNINKMQVFKNTILAESFEPPSIKLEDVELYKRREDYKPTELPDDIIFITAGVDIQGDRIEIEFKGFGLGYENWGVEHVRLMGNTDESAVWERCYRELKKPFYTKTGRKMISSVCLIDSGDKAQRVYSFVKLDKRFFATKGASESEKKKDFINKPKEIQKGVKLYSIGTYAGKSELLRLLRIKDIGAGYCHYPMSYDMDYFQELTAEKLTKTKTKSGYYTYSFQKVRERNEALDLSVLCLAGAKILKLDSLIIKKGS